MRPIEAATITVTTTTDELNTDGDCSLREAIKAANSNAASDACAAGQSDQVDTIVVPAGTYTLMIPGPDGGNGNNDAVGDLDIKDAVTITGAGAATTIIQACDVDQRAADCPAGHGIVDRIFHILNVEATISGVTIRHGHPSDGGGHGIYVHRYFSDPTPALTLSDAVVTKNGTTSTSTGSFGGAGINLQRATGIFTRVTISDNVVGGSRGGGR